MTQGHNEGVSDAVKRSLTLILKPKPQAYPGHLGPVQPYEQPYLHKQKRAQSIAAQAQSGMHPQERRAKKLQRAGQKRGNSAGASTGEPPVLSVAAAAANSTASPDSLASTAAHSSDKSAQPSSAHASPLAGVDEEHTAEDTWEAEQPSGNRQVARAPAAYDGASDQAASTSDSATPPPEAVEPPETSRAGHRQIAPRDGFSAAENGPVSDAIDGRMRAATPCETRVPPAGDAQEVLPEAAADDASSAGAAGSGLAGDNELMEGLGGLFDEGGVCCDASCELLSRVHRVQGRRRRGHHCKLPRQPNPNGHWVIISLLCFTSPCMDSWLLVSEYHSCPA